MQGDSYSRRRGGHVRATPTGIAASLAEEIIQGTSVLRTRLEEQGFQSSDPKRFESEPCVLDYARGRYGDGRPGLCGSRCRSWAGAIPSSARSRQDSDLPTRMKATRNGSDEP